MCKPRKPSSRPPPYIDPKQGPHIGGPSVGVFPFNPLPPTQGFATKFEKKTTDEPGRKSPPSPPLQLNSDSGGAKSKQSKKASSPDQRRASPDTTFVTSPPPSSSDSDGPSPRKAGAIKRPPPSSPEKHKTGAKEPLQNTQHRNSTTYEVEGNTRKKPSSNGKKNRNSTGDKWSSEEENDSDHTVFSKF